MTYVLSEPSDDMSFSKLIFKLARDAIVRIFHFLEDTMEEKMTEKLLFKAFVNGKSEGGLLGNFLNKMNLKDLGREIRTKQATIKTSELFENVDVRTRPTFFQKLPKPL